MIEFDGTKTNGLASRIAALETENENLRASVISWTDIFILIFVFSLLPTTLLALLNWMKKGKRTNCLKWNAR